MFYLIVVFVLIMAANDAYTKMAEARRNPSKKLSIYNRDYYRGF